MSTINNCIFCKCKPIHHDKVCISCFKREIKRVANQNARSKKHNAGSIQITDWLCVLNRFQFKCAKCFQMHLFLTLDHIQSMHNGGLNNINNIQPLCSLCHETKAKIESLRMGNKKKRLLAKELTEENNNDLL